MLYLFTGNSEYLVGEQVKSWKQKFIEKFGDFNLIHIKDINSTDNNFLAENINSSSFLAEKKLVIIDVDKDIKTEKEEFLMKVLEHIPEENIILFQGTEFDKRSKFYKFFKANAELKEFNTKDDSDLYGIISKKYGNKITRDAINLIMKYKAGNLAKITSEIEKLLITKTEIKTDDIIQNIAPELEESIFQVVDEILNKQTNSAIKKIEIILNDTNIYAFYNNLLANLRTSIYIMKLKDMGKSAKEIGETLNLGNRTFLINKNYRISYKDAEKIYIHLINIDKKMKSGKLIGTEDNDFKFELEKCLLK